MAVLMLLGLAGCPDTKDTVECSVDEECGETEECINRLCFGVECGADELACGRECANPQIDLEHCGACGGCEDLAGAAALQCVTGVCVYSCLDGAVDANGDLDEPGSDGCECVPSGPEVCDGVDNDCNGAIDGDDFELAACPNEDGAEGVCEDGGCSYTCKEGAEDVNGDLGTGGNGCECLRGEAEICDGFDNDCDGDIDGDDEDLVEPVCGLSEGVCAGLGTECVDGAPLECSEALYTAYAEAEGLRFQAGVETFCDGSDNNCDGSVDELCCGAREKVLVLAEDTGAMVGAASNGEVAAVLFVGDGVVLSILHGDGQSADVEVTSDSNEPMVAAVFWAEEHNSFFVVHSLYSSGVLVGIRMVSVSAEGAIGAAFEVFGGSHDGLLAQELDRNTTIIIKDDQNRSEAILYSTSEMRVLSTVSTSLPDPEFPWRSSGLTTKGDEVFVLADVYFDSVLSPSDSTWIWRIGRDGSDLDDNGRSFFSRSHLTGLGSPSGGAALIEQGEGFVLLRTSRGTSNFSGANSQRLSLELQEEGLPGVIVAEAEGSFHLEGVADLGGGRVVVAGRQTPGDNSLGRGQLWQADITGGNASPIEVTGSRVISGVEVAAHPHGWWILWSEVGEDVTRRWLGTVINVEGDLLCPWPE